MRLGFQGRLGTVCTRVGATRSEVGPFGTKGAWIDAASPVQLMASKSTHATTTTAIKCSSEPSSRQGPSGERPDASASDSPRRVLVRGVGRSEGVGGQCAPGQGPQERGGEVSVIAAKLAHGLAYSSLSQPDDAAVQSSQLMAATRRPH